MSAAIAEHGKTLGSVRVDVQGLQVRLAGTRTNVVDDVSFQVRDGELLGLVGESGSGKTTIALTLLGHTRRGLEITAGRVMMNGIDMATASARELQRLRAAEVAYVPQDPASALNPALRVRTQLVEVLQFHRDVVAAKGLGEPAARVGEMLEEAGLGGTPGILDAYPHQLSGGQQQRVALAMAFALQPSVIVLDEPTTGLDVTTQRHVLDAVRRLSRSYGVAAVYVSHDLAVVAGLVDSLMVLYAGRTVEIGRTAEVFSTPAHPYTRRLLQAVPSPERAMTLQGIEGQPPHPTQRPAGCEFAPRCPLVEAACRVDTIPLVSVSGGHVARCRRTELTVGVHERRPTVVRTVQAASSQALLRASDLHARYGSTEVLHGVDLTVGRDECVAVVGGSGSGKTTLARCVVGMHGNWTGEVAFDGDVLARLAQSRARPVLQAMQYIFQNPYTALNPRRTIGSIVEAPLAHFAPSMARSERDSRVTQVLEDVSLGPDFRNRYPDQLSGGERQRVAIARALVVSPSLLVCDEITSALDVSVQATIIELLRRLQAERDLALLFITHNLALVRSIAQSVVVLHEGRVVESGPVEAVFERPEDPYTIKLMEDAPSLALAETSDTPVEHPPQSLGNV
jgi:peptide/nickel transport system ATP-binding protein